MSEPVLAQTPGPHVLVTDISTCVVEDDDYHHLAKSLRVRDGDALSISDGHGRWRTATFGPTIEPDGDVITIARPEPQLCIGFALVKSAKPELVVQKLTELGIDRVVPFRAERSVVQWDDARAAKARLRLSRVARQAVMQSKGAWLTEVSPVADLGDLVARHDGPVARADFGPDAIAVSGLVDAADTAHNVLALVGPEGGWSDGERLVVPQAVRLAKNVLRAETACIALATLLASARDSVG